MPIYEYACSECGHEFELMQKVAEHPKRKCPACGRLKARRVVSHTSFVLKGGGWYVTEYGNRKGGKADSPAAAESSPPASSGKKPASKSAEA
jgi:putative FmdB family regulatory protein